MIRHIANIITGCRILGSVILLFFPAFSVEFYIIYIICGFSDMIDGTIARKTNNTGEFGSKLDTTADIVFVTMSMIKIMPTMNLPQWLWIWCVIIAIIKICTIILGYISIKQFVSLHTILNKISGFLLFLLPLTLPFVEAKHSAIIVCSTAIFAAIHEVDYVVTNMRFTKMH